MEAPAPSRKPEEAPAEAPRRTAEDAYAEEEAARQEEVQDAWEELVTNTKPARSTRTRELSAAESQAIEENLPDTTRKILQEQFGARFHLARPLD